MDTIHWVVYSLFLLCEAFVVSFIMEVYKKKIRKDNFKTWEVRALGFFLSAGCVNLLHFSNMIYPLFSVMFGAELWLDYALYLIIFYLIQLNIDMRILKNIIRSLSLQWLRKATGLDNKAIEEILQEVKNRS